MYSYLGIVNDLLKEFPEISKNYAKEIAWIKDTFKGQETGGQAVGRRIERDANCELFFQPLSH